jgi:inorganic triphosphatase YgiF
VTIEREVKLGAPVAFEVPDLAAALPDVTVEHDTSLDLDAVYFDTASLALIGRGITLRRRTGEGPPRWTLKLPATDQSGAALVRREIEVDDPSTEPPPALIEQLRSWSEAEVEPVATVRTARQRTRLVTPDGITVELADDRVTASARGHEVSFRELEAEVVDVDGAHQDDVVRLLDRLTRVLQDAGAGPADPTPKLARVLAQEMTDG